MSTIVNYEVLQRSLLESLADPAVGKLRIDPSSIRPIDHAPVFSGGFGEVQEALYDGRDSTTHVAVKKLKPYGDDNQRLRVAAALIREVAVWSTLHHPNILGILGFDLDEHEFKRAQLLTSWKQNGHVLDYIKRMAPTYTRRLELVSDTAKGLAYLHGLSPKVCHGDVKPENVLVDDSGVAQLCDFGLAKILKDVPSGLTTTTPKMTLIYASPEVAVNNASHTCEDDVWAWGCMVMVVMTGVLPYQEKTTQSTILQAMVARIPPAELTRLPNLSFVLRQLLIDCWSWTPEDRPAMQQCEQRLSSYSTTTSAREATTNESSTRFGNPQISIASSLTNPRQVPAELKVGGEDWFAIFNAHAPRKLDINLVHSFHHESIVSCVRFSSDGRFIATGSKTTAQIFNIQSHRNICTLTHKAAPEKEDSGLQSVCFSPDGNFLATGGEDGLIRVWDIASRKILQTLEGHSDAIYSLVFSRDGQLLVSGSEDETTWVWDLKAGTHRTLSIAETKEVNVDAGVASVAISGRGTHIATGHMDNVVRIWNLASGDLVQCLGGHSDSVYGVAFTPDDKGLVSGGLDKTTKYWDIGPVLLSPAVPNQLPPMSNTGILLSESEGHVLSVAISPDGAWVASGATDFGIQFSDPVTGLLQLTLKGHRNTVTDVDFSPVLNGSGGLLASASGDCTVNLWEYTPYTQP